MKLSEYGREIGDRRFLKALIYGLIAAVGVCAVVLFIAAIIMSSKDMSQSFVTIAADFAVVFSSFSGGLVTSRILKKRGLFSGAFTGLIYYILLILAGLAFFGSKITIAALTKLVMMILASSLGGIVGVNAFRKKKYR